MLVLTRQEIMNLSQIVISSKIKHAPTVFAFTEQGVAMLSSVLRSQRAIQVNIAVMRAFVTMKQSFSLYQRLAVKLKKLGCAVKKHDKEIRVIFETIERLIAPPAKSKQKIGFHP